MADDTKQILPKARTEQLIVKEIDDEVLVYDLKTDQAHCLNKTAALVWQHCDGQRSMSDIADSIAKHTDAPVDERVVLLALDGLGKHELLEKSLMRPAYLEGISRRELAKQVGLAALAIPVILSISSPAPAQTASQCASSNNRPNGCPCGGNGNCASGN